jgi:inosine triphosphate pyrophosphatase
MDKIWDFGIIEVRWSLLSQEKLYVRKKFARKEEMVQTFKDRCYCGSFGCGWSCYPRIMNEIYFVTGNKGKWQELKAMFPAGITLLAHDLDLPELQSMDSEEIVRDKLERAFAVLKKPVIVDDVSAELAHLNGLPGPFIKYFETTLGKGALWELVRHTDNHALLTRCTLGYFDGETYHIVHGEVTGKVVPPRGENGFGFDFVFVPEGETRTTAELPIEEKNHKSHRAMASKKLLKALVKHRPDLYKKEK